MAPEPYVAKDQMDDSGLKMIKTKTYQPKIEDD